MPQAAASIALTVFLALALLLVHRLRREIADENRESYLNILRGLITVVAAAAITVVRDFGYLQSVPFLGQALFFDLSYWILTIVGSVQVISGVATWLPIARRSASNT